MLLLLLILLPLHILLLYYTIQYTIYLYYILTLYILYIIYYTYLGNTQYLWRFDNENAFLQLARSGLPRLHETSIDTKQELDIILKTSCISLKTNTVKVLLGGLDGFLSKVIAFIGEIPISTEGTSVEKPKNDIGNNGNSFFLLFIYLSFFYVPVLYTMLCIVYSLLYYIYTIFLYTLYTLYYTYTPCLLIYILSSEHIYSYYYILYTIYTIHYKYNTVQILLLLPPLLLVH